MVEKELAEVEQDLGDSKKVLRAAKRKKKAKEASGTIWKRIMPSAC
jgi:hypothetical protein